MWNSLKWHNVHGTHKIVAKSVIIGNMRPDVGQMDRYEVASCGKKSHNDVIAMKEFIHMC
jgi:hypothetical protein